VMTPAGIIFKGSGWYATDHRSPSGTSRAGKETSSTSTTTE
jgi:predicted nucleic acid-binding Zn ribbon protein